MNIDFTAIAPLLEQLAQKLGVAVDHLWGVMTKQAYIDGITDMVWFGAWMLLFIISGTVFYFGYRTGKIKEWVSTSSSSWDVFLIIGGTGMIVFFIFAMIIFTDGIKLLLNPEYKAFMDIIGQVKGK